MSKYYYLNLNQKMIKIRRKLPALMRKRYSEEVDYDFVRLDDINQFLTPALNRYGVDFDILREIPTQMNTSGVPVFLVQDGNLWRYEADLEICWTNADNPLEKITSILHLIGTNDVPDKAKGTAMTYGLKYYLLNKFNIPQNAEEDPDMRATKPAKEEAKKGKQGEKTAVPKVEKKEEKEEQVQNFIPDADLTEGLKVKEEQQSDENTQKKTFRDGNAVSKQITGNGSDNQISFTDMPEEDTVFYEEEVSFSSEEEENSFQTETKEEETVADQVDEDFRVVTAEDEVPFSDEEEDFQDAAFMETDIDLETDKIEAAKAVICNFGLYKDRPLGDMLKTPKGWESLKWLVTRYRGGNKEMVEAARILVEADAYHSNAA